MSSSQTVPQSMCRTEYIGCWQSAHRFHMPYHIEQKLKAQQRGKIMLPINFEGKNIWKNGTEQTSKRTHRRTWEITIGIISTGPPISCTSHGLSTSGSLLENNEILSFQLHTLFLHNEFIAIPRIGCIPTIGLDHLMQTRKAKHWEIL